MEESGLFMIPGPSACERERPEVDAALTLAKATLQAIAAKTSWNVRDVTIIGSVEHAQQLSYGMQGLGVKDKEYLVLMRGESRSPRAEVPLPGKNSSSVPRV